MSLPRISRSRRCLVHFQFDCQVNTQRDGQDGENVGVYCCGTASVPLVGATVNSLLGEIIKLFKEYKDLSVQYASLLKELPELLKRLHENATDDGVNEDYKKLNEDFQEKVNKFYQSVKELEEAMSRGHLSVKKSKARRQFKSKLAPFAEDMKIFVERQTDLSHRKVAQTTFTTAEILTIADETRSDIKVVDKTVTVTHADVKAGNKELAETHADVQSGNKKVDDLTKLVQTLIQMMSDPKFAHNLRDGSGAMVLFQVFELKGVLKDLQSRSDKQRREAQRDLVRIALSFVRDGNDQVGATGLMALEKLIVDERAIHVVTENQSVVQTLLDWEVNRPGDKTVESMLKYLAKKSGSFFKQLVYVSKEPKYPPAIARVDLVPRIVVVAKSKVKKQKPSQEYRWEIGDEDALSVLVEIAKSSECKRAIARAGGIAVLVEIYRLLKMTEDAFDSIIVDVVIALAGLAEDARCQDQFAEDRGVWVMVDFLWKCSTTRTERPIEDDTHHHFMDDDGFEVMERTRFNRATVLQAETKAKRALVALAALGADWKRRVLYLGELYLESNNCDLVFDNPDALTGAAKLSPFDAIRGWVRMSNFIEKKQMWETERAYWCVPIVWSLLMEENTSFTAAEWYFGGSLTDRRRCECAIFTIERKSNAWKHFFKWNLDVGKTVESYKLDADSSDEDSYDEDSSDAESLDEEHEEAVDRALHVDHANYQFISSICGYLALPRDKCKKLSTCLRQIMRELEIDRTDKKAKALSVLWLGAGFMTIDSMIVDRLVKICKKAVTSGCEDEVFWATCLLSSMLSWPSVRKRSPQTRREMLELAASSVCVLLNTEEWPKYVFLAKFLVAKESDGMKSACIPFLVTFLKLEGIDGLPDDDDDSYFQSNQYRRSRPIKEKKLKQWCLWELEALWADHKSEITAEGGSPVLKAMLKSSEVNDDVKSDIELALKEKTMNGVEEVAKQNLEDVAP